MMTIAVTLVALPATNAHTPPWTISTYAFIKVQPDPIGVGQTAYISGWLDKVPPTSISNFGMVWHNMKVTVTKPDGSQETLGPFNSDAVGGMWASYVPSQIGTYKFILTFPGQIVVEENTYPYPLVVDIGRAFINDTYTGSTSKEVTLIVQQKQIETAYPTLPLPTDYWQRPINSMNREWYSIAGNWLGLAAANFGYTGMYDSYNGNFNPYTTAPSSAHVVWTKPIAFGGQIGGEFGESDTSLYATGTAYESKSSFVILYGILYYSQYPGAATNRGPLTAVDLRTGKTLWAVNANDTLKCGMIYNFKTGDQYGGIAYLFTEPPAGGEGLLYPKVASKWSMYDAMTGNWILDIANASSGRLMRGENGEILSYSVVAGRLTLWNVTECIANASQAIHTYRAYSAAEIWRPPQGATIDWKGGIEWSAPVATGLGISKVFDDVVLMTQSAPAVPGGHNAGWRVDAGYSAKTGQLLWGPINRTLTPWTGVVLGAARDGVYTEYTRQTLTWIGYDIKTGQKLWGPTAPKSNAFGYYDYTANSVIGYGNLYSWGLGGEVYCYDLKTGTQKWIWNAGSAGIDSPYGTWPLGTWIAQHILADGKLYVRAGHDYTPPVFKGAKLYCINATTGKEIWSSLSFNIAGAPACTDGYMVWFNGYDNQIYSYGKGRSATTVSYSPVIGSSSSVVIKGTVTDQSPGETCLGIPAAGTPGIADESMSAWMEYLYQQRPKPTNATGVRVHLTAYDPNGNFQDIGTTTSTADGKYGITWTPPVSGTYYVTATFEGSNSYYSSEDSTYLAVGPAPATPAPAATPTPTPATPPTATPTATASPSPAPQPEAGPSTDMYIIAAAAVVVIVVVAVAAFALRKRK